MELHDTNSKCKLLRTMLVSGRDTIGIVNLSHEVIDLIGPGTILHSRLFLFSFVSCSCKYRMELMNNWGPRGCKENLSIIHAWFNDYFIIRHVPIIKFFIHWLIDNAIDKSDKLYTMYDLHSIYT